MRTKGKFVVYPLIALLIFGVDQGIKLMVRRLPEHVVFFRFPGLFELIRCTNTGAAFSLFAGHTGLIAVFSMALLGFLFFGLMKSLHLTAGIKILLAILIGAGAGNLFDRIVLGGVTDYIRLLPVSFPVFNFADICITGSVFMLSYFIISGRLDKHPEE